MERSELSSNHTPELKIEFVPGHRLLGDERRQEAIGEMAYKGFTNPDFWGFKLSRDGARNWQTGEMALGVAYWMAEIVSPDDGESPRYAGFSNAGILNEELLAHFELANMTPTNGPVPPVEVGHAILGQSVVLPDYRRGAPVFERGDVQVRLYEYFWMLRLWWLLSQTVEHFWVRTGTEHVRVQKIAQRMGLEIVGETRFSHWGKENLPLVVLHGTRDSVIDALCERLGSKNLEVIPQLAGSTE